MSGATNMTPRASADETRSNAVVTTIRWGMIGCGEVAETRSGPGLYLAANSQLVAVAVRNARRAEEFARRRGISRWHGQRIPTAEEMRGPFWGWRGVRPHRTEPFHRMQ